MGKVIYAFPATGKTYLCQTNKKCIELSSEKFHWQSDSFSEKDKGTYKVINPLWPQNYKEAILTKISQYDYVFITHSGSIICEQNNIPYILVYPSLKCKQEYIDRMYMRGNSKEFIDNMIKNYDYYINSLKENKYAVKKIELNSGQYLSDALKKL